jgi:hypothetical protein
MDAQCFLTPGQVHLYKKRKIKRKWIKKSGGLKPGMSFDL